MLFPVSTDQVACVAGVHGEGVHGEGVHGEREHGRKNGGLGPLAPRPHVFFLVLVPLPLPCLRLLPRLHCKANRKEPYERVVGRRLYLRSPLRELGGGGCLLTTTLPWKVSSHHILETLTSTDKLLGYIHVSSMGKVLKIFESQLDFRF